MLRLVFSGKFGFPHDYHVELCDRYSICYSYYYGQCDGVKYRKPEILVMLYSPNGRRKIYLRRGESDCFTKLRIYENACHEIDVLKAPDKESCPPGAVLVDVPKGKNKEAKL